MDSFLTDLEQLGLFDQVVGLLVGRPGGLDARAHDDFLRVFSDHTEAAGIPVMADLEIGHTDPIAPLPLGALTEMDAGARKLRIAAATS